ncbi:MAG: hypothetical protein K1X66_04495 [Verrucomicrobiae bacterium]|nr:hypothetical protein [Verrucomicrobiae bacterium]
MKHHMVRGGALLLLSAISALGAARKINGPFNAENVAPQVYDFQVSPNPNNPKVVYLANLEDFNIWGLYRVAPGGGPSLKISDSLVLGGQFLKFKMSSDGIWTVFIAEHDKASTPEIFSVLTDGGVVTKLNSPNLDFGQKVKDFRITSDNSKVVYLADSLTLGVFNLEVIPISGGVQPIPITANITPNVEIKTNFLVSAVNNQVVYVADQQVDNKYELFSAAIDGGGSFKLNDALTSGNVGAFDLTPDGSNVVYFAFENGDAFKGVYQASIFSSMTSVQLTPINGGGVEFNLKASPDNTYAVYDVIEGGNYQIKTVPLAVGASSQLVPLGPEDIFSIDYGTSIKGDYVLYTDVDNLGRTELYSISAGGGTAAKLSNVTGTGLGLNNNPPFDDFFSSADNEWVIYRSAQEASGRYEVFRVPLKGGVTSKKLNDPILGNGTVSKFQVSPTSRVGNQIVYLAAPNSDTVTELYSVGFDYLSDFDADSQNDILLRQGKFLKFFSRDSKGQFNIKDFGPLVTLSPGEKVGWVNDVDGDNRPDFSLKKGGGTLFYKVATDLQIERNDTLILPAFPKRFRIRATGRVDAKPVYIATKGKQMNVAVGLTNVTRINEAGFKPVGMGEIETVPNVVLYNARTRNLLGVPILGVQSNNMSFGEPVSLGNLPKKFKKPSGSGQFFGIGTSAVISRQKKNVYLFPLPIAADNAGVLVGALPKRTKIIGPK